VVFSDATLREFASRKPSTLGAFREISGVGDTKLERYGSLFTQAIASWPNGASP
jgi:ATP-dependent DNA helicase RecQ